LLTFEAHLGQGLGPKGPAPPSPNILALFCPTVRANLNHGPRIKFKTSVISKLIIPAVFMNAKLGSPTLKEEHKFGLSVNKIKEGRKQIYEI
jgi:hypothetical protein